MLSEKELKLLDKIQNRTVYEDKFFEKTSDLKWFDEIKNRGYFNPNPNTSPQETKEGYFFIPQWNVLSYLEKVSQQVNIAGNERYIDELLTIIKEVSNFKDSRGQHLDNYRTWFYFVKILCNIPNDKIPIDVIDQIPIWLDSRFDTTVPESEITTKLLPKFLTDNVRDITKAEKIIGSITAIKTYPLSGERAKIVGKNKEEKLAVDPYWLKEAFDKYSQVIGEKCSKKVIEDLANKIKSLLKNEEDGSYESFYEEPNHTINDPLRMLTIILKRIMVAKAKSDVETGKEILKGFLRDKFLLFPKMAIYVIGQHMDYYDRLFWEILESKTGAVIMGNTLYFGDELKYLLKNLKPLSDEQRKILQHIIEQGVKHNIPKEDTERYLTLFKQEIYEALSHDPYFKGLYEEMKKVTKRDAALHPAIGKIRTRWGPGPAPITKEEILRMTNTELAEFLSKFKTKDSWEGPTVGGLSDILREAVKTDPVKFIDDLTPFENTGFIYIYRMLDGFKDVWKEKKAIDWGKILDFVSTYVQKQQFWNDEYIVEKDEWLGGADHNWVTATIAELIEEGTRDDSWAFPEEYFEKAGNVIFTLLKDPMEEKEDTTDYVTHALNTPCGKLLTALIYLSLRIARVNIKKGIKEEPKWEKKYKNKYDEMLAKKVNEAFTNLGRYLPNLAYLDRAWAEGKIKGFSSGLENKYWEAIMSGYLSIGKVYDDLYELMKPYYQYGLSYGFKEKSYREHLIQHICIGYLGNHEKIEDPESLFRKVIDTWNPEQIREVIAFFWMQRDYLKETSAENEEIKKKIFVFWKFLYERYKGKDEEKLLQEDKKILSSTSKLSRILSEIDVESYEWLMSSAPYVHEDFNSSFFIECLDELKNKGEVKESAKYIGKIYLKMLEKITPDFDKKHIRSIVEFLYNNDVRENANEICNIYGSRGYEFLRDIFEKYNPSK